MSDYKSIIKGTIQSISDKAKDLAESGAVREVYEKGTGKAKAAVGVAKLSMEYNGEAEDLKKAYTEIGKLYYEENKGNPQGFFVPLFEKVDEIVERMEAMQHEIEAMKAELQMGGDDDCCCEDADFESVVEQAEDDATKE